MIVVMSLDSKFQVSLPVEFRPFLEQFGSGHDLDEIAMISLAIEMYIGKKVSLARAAQLAQKSPGVH